jgi:hypothetical protein
MPVAALVASEPILQLIVAQLVNKWKPRAWRHTNPVHSLTPSILIVPSKSRSSRWSLPFRVSNQSSVRISHHPRPSCPSEWQRRELGNSRQRHSDVRDVSCGTTAGWLQSWLSLTLPIWPTQKRNSTVRCFVPYWHRQLTTSLPAVPTQLRTLF